jgi:sec-independent protein translocase protein TatA
MGSFSIAHWLVVLAVIVLLFGAKKIPDLAKGIGQGIKDFKKAVKEEDTAADSTPASKEIEGKDETKAAATSTKSENA